MGGSLSSRTYVPHRKTYRTIGSDYKLKKAKPACAKALAVAEASAANLFRQDSDKPFAHESST